MLFEEFQDGHHGSHLGYQNVTILAILNLCRSGASHQILAQSYLQFGRRCCLKFQDGQGYWKGTILAILNLYVAQMPSTKFWLNLT